MNSQRSLSPANHKRALASISAVLACAVLVAVSLSAVFCSENADAEKEHAIVDSGISKQCSWSLDDAGHLIIGTEDSIAFMEDYGPRMGSFAPWGDKVTSVTIMPGVRNIGSYAFFECKELEQVSIPSSIVSIGSHAFFSCTSLEAVDISECNDLGHIGDYAFCNCSSLEKFIVGNSIISFGDWSMAGCSSLKEVDLGTAAENIGCMAFMGCSSLESFLAPITLDTVYDNAFVGCPDILVGIQDFEVKLSELYKQAQSPGDGSYHCSHYSSSGKSKDCDWRMDNDGNLFISGNGHMDSYGYLRGGSAPWGDKVISVSVSEGVKDIGNDAFSGCKSLRYVDLPASLECIGHRAFRDCSELRSADLGDCSKLSAIGDYAFSGCSHIVNLSLNGPSVYIGNYAFSGCASLGAIEIGNGANISYLAFENCCALKSVDISGSNLQVKYNSFNGCPDIKADLGDSQASLSGLSGVLAPVQA